MLGVKLNEWRKTFRRFQRWSAGPVLESTMCHWRPHCFVRPAVSLITRCRGGPQRGQVRQYGAWETPRSSPENALIKPPATTSQHLAPSTQLEDTQVKVATGIIYQRCVCMCVCVCVFGFVCAGLK